MMKTQILNIRFTRYSKNSIQEIEYLSFIFWPPDQLCPPDRKWWKLEYWISELQDTIRIQFKKSNTWVLYSDLLTSLSSLVSSLLSLAEEFCLDFMAAVRQRDREVRAKSSELRSSSGLWSSLSCRRKGRRESRSPSCITAWSWVERRDPMGHSSLVLRLSSFSPPHQPTLLKYQRQLRPLRVRPANIRQGKGVQKLDCPIKLKFN